MLALDTTKPSRKLTPNILPCTIKHNGPITTSKRYWAPSSSPSPNGVTQHTTYFRGRKLRGRAIRIPDGYQGYVLAKTDNLVPQKPAQKPHAHVNLFESEDRIEDELDEDKPVEVKMMEQKGCFDQIMVWEHEVEPEAGDEYIKGVEEWVAFAEAVCMIPVTPVQTTHARTHTWLMGK
ncbi:hypothetical protein LTR36_003756 [Oleoguttula mirabilis]|uniref:Uncharacterized protein n=1 Tax=Oleoguttula mirabilis TaxID=1507867 RepID=A0AAV9JHH1_9PEZI|nr:hypothetical protein LTR36_003756 [Oleoguttula mirabilis]